LCPQTLTEARLPDSPLAAFCPVQADPYSFFPEGFPEQTPESDIDFREEII
jgi:hypothetical protein